MTKRRLIMCKTETRFAPLGIPRPTDLLRWTDPNRRSATSSALEFVFTHPVAVLALFAAVGRLPAAVQNGLSKTLATLDIFQRLF